MAIKTLLCASAVIAGLIGYGMVRSHITTTEMHRSAAVTRMAIACKENGLEQVVCLKLLTATFIER